jgi:glycosyltransferase involved in cell wall biosynthesis
MMKKILAVSVSPFDGTRSRIIKEMQSLSANFITLIASLNTGVQLSDEKVQGVSVRRISVKTKILPGVFIFQIPKLIEFGIKIISTFKKYDIIDCHCLISLSIGFIYKKLYHAKLVFNAHELETERNGLHGIAKKIFKILEKMLIYKCDAVIVVSDSIEQWYKDKYKIQNIYCIYNSPRYLEFAKTNYFKSLYNLKETDKIFLYQGMLSPGRGIENLLNIFDSMQSTGNYLVLMGNGLLEEKIRGHTLYNPHILFHEAVPQNKLVEYTSSADFGLSTIENTCMSYYFCMPNKLFEYIMYEIPVIVSNTKDQAEFVKKNNIGYVLENDDKDTFISLLNSINNLKYNEMLENVHVIKKAISWDSQEEKLLSIYYNL